MLPINTIVFILVCSMVSFIHLEQVVKNVNNYGPYILSIDQYSSCKGPKAINLTIMSTKIDFVNLTFLVDAKIEEMKIVVFSDKDNKRDILWNYKLNDPCKHYAFAAFIKQYLNTQNCYVKKGTYTNAINFAEVTSSFLGTSFFYGTYTFKASITSKKGNIACFASTLTFKKKNL